MAAKQRDFLLPEEAHQDFISENNGAFLPKNTPMISGSTMTEFFTMHFENKLNGFVAEAIICNQTLQQPYTKQTMVARHGNHKTS